MSTRFSAIAVALLATACGRRAAPATPEAPRDTVAEVRTAADAFDRAQLEGDRATIERYLADDLVFVRGSGKVADRASFIASFTSPTSKLEPFELVDRRLIPLGRDAVIASAEVTLRGTEDGEAFEEHIRFADVFVRRDDRWQVVYIQVTMVR